MHAGLAQDPTRALTTGNVRAVLARRGFRRLLAVRLFSQLGDGVFQAGLAGSVFFNPERAASPLAIAAAFAVLLVPYSALGPFVGVFLDRWSRRQVLFGANAVRAALVLPCAWLVWHGDEGVPFVALALAIIALNRFFLAGLSASQPHVVDEPRLVTANSFATTAGSVCYSGGLALAGVTFHVIGTGFHQYAVVAATAVLWYGLSATTTLASFRIDALGPDDAERPAGSLAGALVDHAHGMVAGFAHLRGRAPAWSVIVAQAVHRGHYGVLAMMTLLLYRNYFHVGDPEGAVTGLLQVAAAAALGSLVAAAVTPPLTRRLGGWRWVAVLLGSLAVALPALGTAFQPLFLVLAASAVSIATQGLKIVTDTTLQVHCDDDFRGRVFSINDTALNLFFVVGLYLGALLLPEDGHSVGAMLALGGGFAALAAWYTLVSLRQETAR
jgi:MFS family permease